MLRAAVLAALAAANANAASIVIYHSADALYNIQETNSSGYVTGTAQKAREFNEAGNATYELEDGCYRIESFTNSSGKNIDMEWTIWNAGSGTETYSVSGGAYDAATFRVGSAVCGLNSCYATCMSGLNGDMCSIYRQALATTYAACANCTADIMNTQSACVNSGCLEADDCYVDIEQVGVTRVYLMDLKLLVQGAMICEQPYDDTLRTQLEGAVGTFLGVGTATISLTSVNGVDASIAVSGQRPLRRLRRLLVTCNDAGRIDRFTFEIEAQTQGDLDYIIKKLQVDAQALQDQLRANVDELKTNNLKLLAADTTSRSYQLLEVVPLSELTECELAQQKGDAITAECACELGGKSAGQCQCEASGGTHCAPTYPVVKPGDGHNNTTGGGKDDNNVNTTTEGTTSGSDSGGSNTMIIAIAASVAGAAVLMGVGAYAYRRQRRAAAPAKGVPAAARS